MRGHRPDGEWACVDTGLMVNGEWACMDTSLIDDNINTDGAHYMNDGLLIIE